MDLPGLRDLHLSLGARLVVTGMGERIAGYGSLEDEYRALRDGCGLLDRSSRGTLRVTGTERVEFVHGMTTADIKGLPAGRACYTALLTAKGKMVADARVLKRADELLLDTEPGMEAAVAQFLDGFLISEDAAIASATGSLGLLSFLGPRAFAVVGAILGAPLPELEEGESREPRAGWTALGTRLGALSGVDLLVPGAEAAAATRVALERGASAGLRPVGEEAFEVVRVEEGVPRYGADLDAETIPLEASLERAISYTKGCYIGQEVIARATHRGGVKRKLTRFAFPAGAPAPRAALFRAGAEDKAVGEVTSVVRSPRLGDIGLGYVRRELLADGTELVAGDGRTALVRPLPSGPGEGRR